MLTGASKQFKRSTRQRWSRVPDQVTLTHIVPYLTVRDLCGWQVCTDLHRLLTLESIWQFLLQRESLRVEPEVITHLGARLAYRDFCCGVQLFQQDPKTTSARKWKLTLVGAATSGKSWFRRVATGEVLSDAKYEQTVGAEFGSCTGLIIRNNKQVTVGFQIWDTAGDARYASMRPMYYRGADTVVGVYDVTNQGSLTELDTILAGIVESGGTHYYAVVGTKVDLPRKVSPEGARQIAAKYKATYFECSATNAVTVYRVLYCLVRHLSRTSWAQPQPVCCCIDKHHHIRHI